MGLSKPIRGEKPVFHPEPESINQIPEYDLKVSRIIKDFKQQMAMYHENPNFKSGESLEADSALWLLEATINYSHAFPNDFYNEFRVDSGTLVLPVNSQGKIDLGDVVEGYDEMKQQVTGYYYNSPFSTKGLCAVDLEPLSQSQSETTFLVMTITGDEDGDPPPVVLDGPFEEGDDWWYGEDYGYCYDHSVWDDATNQLYTEAVPLIPDPNGNYYFINQFTFTIQGGDQDLQRDLTLDNYLDFYLFYAIEGDNLIPLVEDQTLCLEWQEMNNYFVFLKALIFDILPNDYLPNVLGAYGFDIESFIS